MVPRTVIVLGLVLAGMQGPARAEPGRGEAVYQGTCVACHGADGSGALPGVPDLRERLGRPDTELLRSMMEGLKSPGFALRMPPKGGNPELTEEDMREVLRYMRAQFGA